MLHSVVYATLHHCYEMKRASFKKKTKTKPISNLNFENFKTHYTIEERHKDVRLKKKSRKIKKAYTDGARQTSVEKIRMLRLAA